MKLILKIIFLIVLIILFIIFFIEYKTYKVNHFISFELSDIKSINLISNDYNLDLKEQKIIISGIKKQKFKLNTNGICYGIQQKNFIDVKLKNGLKYSVYFNNDLADKNYLICVNEFPMYINSY